MLKTCEEKHGKILTTEKRKWFKDELNFSRK